MEAGVRCGVRTYSACVPSISLPGIQPPVVQCESFPRRQYPHLPQAEMQEMRTPGFESSDAGANAIDDADALVTEDTARRPGHIVWKLIRDVRGSNKLIFRLHLLFSPSLREPLSHLSEENQECPQAHLRSPRQKI